MAPSITKTLLKRRKAIKLVDDNKTAIIPIRELPYELQILIGRECILTPVPIIVGKTISRYCSDPTEEVQARACNAMLRVSRDFRNELYRIYYAENVFELGFYYDRSNFFKHPGMKLVQYVLVDALRALVQPEGVPSTVIERLKMLPSLKRVSIRLKGSQANNRTALLHSEKLTSFLIALSRNLALQEVELLIEPRNQDDIDADLQEYRNFLLEAVKIEGIWPLGQPAGQSMPRFVVNREQITPSGWEHFVAKTNGESKKMRKGMKALISEMRRSSVSSNHTVDWI